MADDEQRQRRREATYNQAAPQASWLNYPRRAADGDGRPESHRPLVIFTVALHHYFAVITPPSAIYGSDYTFCYTMSAFL